MNVVATVQYSFEVGSRAHVQLSITVDAGFDLRENRDLVAEAVMSVLYRPVRSWYDRGLDVNLTVCARRVGSPMAPRDQDLLGNLICWAADRRGLKCLLSTFV